MIIPYLLIIFLFGSVISVIVFLGFQQSADWAKVLADQQRLEIQTRSKNREIVPLGVESDPIKPAAADVRKS